MGSIKNTVQIANEHEFHPENRSVAFYDGKSDSEIWSQFKKGDEKALICIYSRHGNSLYNYGCQITSNEEYVQDCIQDLFYEIIDKSHKLGEVISIKGYLFKSLKRKLLLGIKKQRKIPHSSIDNAAFQIAIKPESIEMFGNMNEGISNCLQDSLNKLSIQQREVIILHFYDGLSYAEISEIMDIKVKSVRMLTFRAIQSLRLDISKDQISILPCLAIVLLS